MIPSRVSGNLIRLLNGVRHFAEFSLRLSWRQKRCSDRFQNPLPIARPVRLRVCTRTMPFKSKKKKKLNDLSEYWQVRFVKF